MMQYKLFTLCCLLMYALLGCQSITFSPPIQCNRIYDATILKYPFDAGLSLERSVNWIKTNLSISSLATSLHTDGTNTIDWEAGISQYTLSINSKGSTASIYWNTTRPKIADMLRCFGAPESYRAVQIIQPDGFNTRVDFWYPSSGSVFGTSLKGKRSAIDGSDELYGVGFTRPASVMDMHRRLTSGSGNFERDAQFIKPWPGSVETMKVDVLPTGYKQ